MKTYWDCGRCGNQIEHRWERDRLVFACKSSTDTHFFEEQITTSIRYKSDMWVWAIPMAEIVGLIAMLA
jgi:hypothetical protein